MFQRRRQLLQNSPPEFVLSMNELIILDQQLVKELAAFLAGIQEIQATMCGISGSIPMTSACDAHVIT
jgi:hypothetical protein